MKLEKEQIPEINLELVSVPVTAKPIKLKAVWKTDIPDEPSTETVEVFKDPVKKLMKNIGYEVVPDEVIEREINTHFMGAEVETELVKQMQEEIRKEIDMQILASLTENQQLKQQ
jgi:hypothetical protein